MPLAATPLHQACAGRHADTVLVLLKAGASENAFDNQDRRPVDALPDTSDAAREACAVHLYNAAELDETPGKRLSELLKQGEKDEAAGMDVQAVLAFFDKDASSGKDASLGINDPVMRLDGETPLGFVANQRGAAWCTLARELIARGADVNAVSAALNETPLFAAASLGSLDMVTLLVSAGANVNWAKSGTFEGFTPLIECLAAIYRGGDRREETALALLAAGASTHIVLKKDSHEGMMPLHFAIKAGFLRATKAIMERGGPGADVYARAGYDTAMMMADLQKLKGDSSIEDYLKEVAPPPPPAPESRCVIC
jgi:ankyrin repeat protein